MTVEDALSRAKYLIPSYPLMSSNYFDEYDNVIPDKVYDQMVRALSVKMGRMNTDGVTMPEKISNVSIENLFFGYADSHSDFWRYDVCAAPSSSMWEINAALGKYHIDFSGLEIIRFLYNALSDDSILSWDGGSVPFSGEEDWAEDFMNDHALPAESVMYGVQYVTRTILELEQPLNDPKYDNVMFTGGMSVSAWCETMFDELNILDMEEDIYYSLFPIWMHFLTSYSGGTDGRFWYFNFPARINQYLNWRSEHKDHSDEVLQALDQTVTVLKEPFLSDEALYLSRRDTVAVLFTENTYVECINPFLPYAQEIFDTLYPEYLRIKEKS